MKGVDLEKSIKCSENLCDVILSDVIDLMTAAKNADAINRRTAELIKDIGSEKKMILHDYVENKIIWFTLVNKEDKNYITVKIIIKDANTIYMDLVSNLDSSRVYGALN